MEVNFEERNKSQIIRVDARNCFVESKSDAFEINKAHLEFATYDTSKPSGQRQTNHVHIYIDVPEFLHLAHEALSGMFHAKARQQRAKNDINTALYKSLGGTSAEKLSEYGRARQDKKSLSRTFEVSLAKDADTYILTAKSGPGKKVGNGLIAPEFGNKPENRVSVKMDWRAINEFLLMTKIHYEAWLAAKYMAEPGTANLQNSRQIKPPQVKAREIAHQPNAQQRSIKDTGNTHLDKTIASVAESGNIAMF